MLIAAVTDFLIGEYQLLAKHVPHFLNLSVVLRLEVLSLRKVIHGGQNVHGLLDIIDVYERVHEQTFDISLQLANSLLEAGYCLVPGRIVDIQNAVLRLLDRQQCRIEFLLYVLAHFHKLFCIVTAELERRY
jgi:hypothetical protein